MITKEFKQTYMSDCAVAGCTEPLKLLFNDNSLKDCKLN